MATKRIFFLSSAQLVAHHWRRGRFTERYVFAADDNGLAQFATYLAGSDPDPVSLLVDVVEEEFREETVPHVLGLDRKALLKTRRTRLFRDATYSHAEVQGREADGRRDDRVMFTALIRPDMLAPWLQHVARLKIPLAGIYSLPLLSESLLKPLKISASHALVVSLHSSGGLRQSFFVNQRLKLSRLAVTPAIEDTRYPSYMLAEIEKLRRYLGSLRQLARDTPLDVFIISEGSKLEELKRQAADSVTSRHQFLDTLAVAKKIGLKGATVPLQADHLFAHLLAKRPPSNHYAPQRETRYFSMQRARTGMVAASVLMLVCSIGWSGYRFVEFVEAKQDTLRVKRETVFYTRLLTDARENLPPAPALAREIQAAVEIADVVRDYRASPLKMMTTLSQGLDAFPELHIDELEWLATADPDAQVDGRSASNSRARSNAGVPPEETGDQYHVAQIRGHIAPFEGDYRAALATVNRFREVLSRLDSVEQVDALSLPFNTGSQQRLLGSAGSGSRVGEATFRLRVVLKSRSAPEEQS